jgi:hypothetical protein
MGNAADTGDSGASGISEIDATKVGSEVGLEIDERELREGAGRPDCWAHNESEDPAAASKMRTSKIQVLRKETDTDMK